MIFQWSKISGIWLNVRSNLIPCAKMKKRVPAIDHMLPEVRFNAQTQQRQLHARSYYRRGDFLCTFDARAILPEPTYLTIQTDIDTHILFAPEFLQYCNHSCMPNIFFDTAAMQVVALRDISAGEELTFFYPSTEWLMAQPFQCLCGTVMCIGEVRGAAHLADEILQKYCLTEFIRHQLELDRLAGRRMSA